MLAVQYWQPLTQYTGGYVHLNIYCTCVYMCVYPCKYAPSLLPLSLPSPSLSFPPSLPLPPLSLYLLSLSLSSPPLFSLPPPSQYDEYKTPMDNIGMQDSLLSRFDVIFVVLDEVR